jgi:hypothetical protein
MMIIMVISVGLLWFLKNPVIQQTTHAAAVQEEVPPSVRDGVMKIWNMMTDKRFWFILPQALWTGVSIAYYSGNLVDML